MTFIQTPPELGNQLDNDAPLQELLARHGLYEGMREELRHLGERAGGDLYRLQQADRLNEPRLVQWDAWGNRVDTVEVTELWKEAAQIAAKHGLVASAYEDTHGDRARLAQLALVYVVDASLDVYSCPLAMTDGAARTLIAHGHRALIDRAVPRLTSRDPAKAWTSGQWMTERTGGSDVGLSETEARRVGEGWHLYGTKWFTSAVTSQMALTLARPTGNGPGGSGLALFYLELRDDAGRLQGITVNRLKDKLGTRKVPTAELTLEGTPATPVIGLDGGVRAITPMLNITRFWNSMGAASGMRRAVALARDYAKRRVQFGAALSDKPLHLDTLAGMAAETEGALHLTARAAELLGRLERGTAGDEEQLVQRILTPIVKLLTGKQAVAVASEALESFGGAGYVEDTGLPRLLRDAQVLPIWEGTTNVLSLDVLRVLGKGSQALVALLKDAEHRLGRARDTELRGPIEASKQASAHAVAWLEQSLHTPAALEAGARRFAITLGRAYTTALLCEHAQWALDNGKGRRALLAARRYARHGLDAITDETDPDTATLARG